MKPALGAAPVETESMSFDEVEYNRNRNEIIYALRHNMGFSARIGRKFLMIAE
jgi:hypothetical protein